MQKQQLQTQEKQRVQEAEAQGRMYEFEKGEARQFRDENRQASLINNYENYANAMRLSQMSAISEGVGAIEAPFGKFAEQ